MAHKPAVPYVNIKNVFLCFYCSSDQMKCLNRVHALYPEFVPNKTEQNVTRKQSLKSNTYINLSMYRSTHIDIPQSFL